MNIISNTSIFFYCLDWLAIFAFYLWSFKRFGVVSFASIWIILRFMLPILVPFFWAFSEMNYVASKDIFLYRHLINQAFIVSSVGLLSFLIGAVLSYQINFRPIGLPLFVRSLQYFWLTKVGTRMIGLFVVLAIVMLVGVGVPFFEGRSYGHTNPVARFLQMIISPCAMLFLYISMIYAYINRNIINYFIVLGLAMVCLWSGARSTVIYPIILFICSIAIYRNEKNILKYFFIALFAMTIVIVLGLLRGESEMISLEEILGELFYGNTFSDLRDFAWIYYYWNGEFLLGKTQMSGILSFLPSELSELKRNWIWGRWSTSTALLNPELHAGLRPGPFGESYFNFGLIGVILMGGFLGAMLGRLDKVLANIRTRTKNKLDLKTVCGLCIYFDIVTSLTISAGYFVIYFKLILIFGGVLIIKLCRINPTR